MNQHTPGPWKVKIASDGYTQFEILGRPESIEQAFANARLIAAAPDLLEALREIAEMSEGGRQTVTECVTALRQIDVDAAAAVTRGHFMSIREKALAVIEKATQGGVK